MKQFLWVLPFLAFVAGYYGMLKLCGAKSISVPSIVGMPLEQALALVSASGLHLHLLAEQEQNGATGIVVEQVPDLGSVVREQQAVYCIITKRPTQQVMPNFIHQSIQAATETLARSNIRYKIYYMPSECPTQMCIAQFPSAGTLLEHDAAVILYSSSGKEQQVVCPTFVGKAVDYVIEFLTDRGLRYELMYDERSNAFNARQYHVIDQRPLAGSIIRMNQNGTSTTTIVLRCQRTM